MSYPSDPIVIAALDKVLKPLGTSLAHYMPGPKADAIEAMRGVLTAQIQRDADIAGRFATMGLTLSPSEAEIVDMASRMILAGDE